MKKQVIFTLLGLSVLASSAFADVGNGRVLTCGTPQKPEIFEIHKTAIAGRFEATMSGIQKSFVCNPQRPNPKLNMNRTWECVENRGGDGKYIVEVDHGGFTGGSNAHLFIEQTYPVKPKYLGTLSCR